MGSRNDCFLALSIALTGESDLDHGLARELEHRLANQYGAQFAEFLEAFKTQGGSGAADDLIKKLLEDPKAGRAVLDHRNRVARAIITAWYTGQFNTPFELADAPQTPEQYSKGLLWSVIGAHAPGFTNAGFGAWAEKPVQKKNRQETRHG